MKKQANNFFYYLRIELINLYKFELLIYGIFRLIIQSNEKYRRG